MLTATSLDRQLVVEILCESFNQNQSVNYIVKQGPSRDKSLRKLMEYSFDVCMEKGAVLLSEDKTACALVSFPDQKVNFLRSTMLDLKLIISCIGISGLGKTLNREKKIKELQGREPMYYLWFIGVKNAHQNQGVGSKLLQEIIEDSRNRNRPIYLETSTLKNIPWYQKFGFTVYNELELTYKLFFLKKTVQAGS